jgi:hypothetical protein
VSRPDEDLDDMMEVVDDQIRAQGASAIRVNDGHVFTFTVETLELLLSKAVNGKVVLFVKQGSEG